jgi:hypothetical protein
MGWAETVASVARTEQPVGFGGPEPAIGFHDATPPRAAFSQGYGMPSAGRPLGKMAGQRCHNIRLLGALEPDPTLDHLERKNAISLFRFVAAKAVRRCARI